MNILVSWGWGVLAPPLLSSLPWWWVGWRGEVEGGGVLQYLTLSSKRLFFANRLFGPRLTIE